LTDDERSDLIASIKYGDPGLALIEHLSLKWRKKMSQLVLEVDPENSGRVGQLQGAIIELNLLEEVLKADFESVADRLEMEAV